MKKIGSDTLRKKSQNLLLIQEGWCESFFLAL